MKTARFILLIALAWAIPAGAQTTAISGDTVHITIQGDLADVTIVPFRDVSAHRIGDTLFFQATALDSEGDTLSGVLWTWASSDPSIISIDASTGVAVALRKTPPNETVDIYVMAELFDAIDVGFFLPDGSFTLGEVDIQVGDTVRGCAFMVRDGTVIASSSLECRAAVNGDYDFGVLAHLWTGRARLRQYQAINAEGAAK